MGTTLAERLKRVITEELNGAKQNMKQPPPAAPKPDSAQASSQPPPVDDEKTEKLSSGEVETNDVISQLNSIRAGRSFKDSAVAGPMEAYIDKLDAAEKTALYAFLSGLAQIVTGQVSGETATDPSDHPADVEMKKQAAAQPGSNSPRTKSVKPNVVGKKQPQQSAASRPKPRSSVEDTTSPTPIVPRAR